MSECFFQSPQDKKDHEEDEREQLPPKQDFLEERIEERDLDLRKILLIFEHSNTETTQTESTPRGLLI